MSQAMSLPELARATGETEERIEQWRSLGLVGSPEAEGFKPQDVERVLLIRLFLRRGIELDAVLAWVASGNMDSYLERIQPAHRGRGLSFDEAAKLTGIGPELLGRIMEAMGFHRESDEIAEEDIPALKRCKEALGAGFPAEAIIELVRVYADAMARVAEAETNLFHFYVVRRLREQGLAGREFLDAMRVADERTTPLIEPVLLYFHHRALERAMRENVVLALAEETGLSAEGGVPGQLTVAIAFVDLSSFTPLAEAMGDLKAAEVLNRFSSLVRDAAGHWQGRVVKQIGDGFMLVFPEARSAVGCVLEIRARASEEPQFPAVRAGVHWGSVLYREGDYVGANVIIASRLSVEAGRHQVLLTEAARREAVGLDGMELVRLGRRRFKGLAEEIEVFEARAAAGEGEAKVVDPVCAMELASAEVAASLMIGGQQVAFCSEECLRRYVASPQRYSAASA